MGEKKEANGVELDNNQKLKLAKKEELLYDLDLWTKAREPHLSVWSAVVTEILNPLFGVRVKLEGRTEPLILLAAHMDPPISEKNLQEVDERYKLGQELKVRVMRNGYDVTDMTVEDEDYFYEDSCKIVEALTAMRTADEKMAEDLWYSNKYSTDLYKGFVTGVKDQCIFVRVNDCREVRISSGELITEFRYKDAVSHVPKTRREAIQVGMEVHGIKLKYDWKSDRIFGSMLRDL